MQTMCRIEVDAEEDVRDAKAVLIKKRNRSDKGKISKKRCHFSHLLY